MGVAILDINISAILSFLLYVVLRWIANGNGTHNLIDTFYMSIKWIHELGLCVVSVVTRKPCDFKLTNLPDIHLLPLLLTTFIPVTLYMSVFIILSFAKPILRFSERIFIAVGEKEDSVFKQFGVLLATIMAAVKAIYDYLTI